MPCFWSRALFLSIKRCLAAVIESSVFRFDILTTSAEEPETKKKNEEAIDLNEKKTSTADRDNLAQSV